MLDTTVNKIYCRDCNCRLFSINGYTECYKQVEDSFTTDYYLCNTCTNKSRIAEYQKDGTISTRIWLDASMHNSYKGDYSNLKDIYAYFHKENALVLETIFAEMNEVQKCMKEFEQLQWIPWIRAFYKKKGCAWSYKIGEKTEIMMCGSAGRVLITIKNKESGAWITLIFEDGGKEANGGIQGLCASKREALNLLDFAMKMPENSFKRDDKICII